MKKKKLFILILAVIVLIGIFYFFEIPSLLKEFKGRLENLAFKKFGNLIYREDDYLAVKKLVEDFGSKLKNVTLTAPKEVIEKQIKENYREYLAPELISKWINDPSQALGRVTSSPWPEKIEIKKVEKVNNNKFIVIGEIVEMTSTGEAGRHRAIFIVERKIDVVEKEGEFPTKQNSGWLITDIY